MAEAGSFADRVKQQADIVRVVGEYVRLKKSGQNFTGLCPFHSEKTASFAVHPVRQIYHCFGCGVGGDVFSFVMAMDKVTFPEAVRAVAEKSGIAVPPPRELSPEERQISQQRTALVEMHREASIFFGQQLATTPEGRAACAYLLDRGLDTEAVARFSLGYAPSGGEALTRVMREKYPEKLLEASGLFSRDPSGRLYDRFRRRIMFPIANESGKVVAFGGRALGDDLPKYLNSPETPIYTKSQILYNMHRAKEALQTITESKARYVVLVEGYVDCIRVDSSKIPEIQHKMPVVASCGTSLTETQARLIHRLAPRVIVWYDMDSPGRAATDRSLELLLTQEIEVDVYPYASSSVSDPDTYIREVGAASASKPIVDPCERFVSELSAEAKKEALQKELKDSNTPYFDEYLQKESESVRRRGEIEAQLERQKTKASGQSRPFKDFLIERATQLFDLSRTEGKLQAVNFLLPYVQRVPNAILRSEWASRIAQQLRIEEPVLRESMRKAASERRSEVKTRPELIGRAGKPAERRLVQMLIEAEEFRARLAQEIRGGELHRGLETERIFSVLVEACEAGGRPDAAALAEALEERDRRLLFEIAFEAAPEPSWDEAEDCLRVLRLMQLRPRLIALKQSNLQELPHEQVLAVQGKIQELQGIIAKLEGKLDHA